MVQEIEDFGPELEAGLLVPPGESETFQEGRIQCAKVGTNEDAPAERAELTGRREDEGAGIEPLVGRTEDRGFVGETGSQAGAVLSEPRAERGRPAGTGSIPAYKRGERAAASEIRDTGELPTGARRPAETWESPRRSCSPSYAWHGNRIGLCCS